jgi:hypothetical protein
MKKSIQIEVPNGYEIDKENSTFENIVFKPIEADLPETWGDMGYIDGYRVLGDSDIEQALAYDTTFMRHRHIFATKEQAKASIALAQLSQLREVYRDGWKPDWDNRHQDKHVIEIYSGEVSVDDYITNSQFLSFQSEKVRDMFLENFRDLIEQAKPLML